MLPNSISSIGFHQNISIGSEKSSQFILINFFRAQIIIVKLHNQRPIVFNSTNLVTNFLKINKFFYQKQKICKNKIDLQNDNKKFILQLFL